MTENVLFFIDNRSKRPLHDECCRIIEDAAAEALVQAGVSTDVEVSLSLVNDDEMKMLNKKYRGFDKTTDVLAFSQFPPQTLQNETKTFGEGPLVLGDIIISIDKMAAQATAYGHSPQREMAFLVTHGMLHLLGFDHQTPEDEARMTTMQNAAMGKLNIDASKGEV